MCACAAGGGAAVLRAKGAAEDTTCAFPTKTCRHACLDTDEEAADFSSAWIFCEY